MTVEETEELAKKIVDDLFTLGDEPNSPCTRIQFIAGETYEIPQGGMARGPLQRFVKRCIQSWSMEKEMSK